MLLSALFNPQKYKFYPTREALHHNTQRPKQKAKQGNILRRLFTADIDT